jgi:uncharacterized RDD family membrane protein YckC
VPAELDRRFYAYVVDRAIGWGLGAAVGALLWFSLDEHRAVVVAGAVVGTIVLVSLFLAVPQGTSGATPGKSALGIRTISVDTGRAPGVGRALTRGLLLGAAGLPTAFLGVATLAWTAAMDRHNRGRAWHDQVTRSLVVDVRRRRAADHDPVPESPRGMVNLTAMRLMPTPEIPAQEADPARVDSGRTATAEPRGGSATPSTHPKVQPGPQPPRVGLQPQAQTSTRNPEHPPAAAAPAAPAARWRVTFDTGENFVVEGLALVGRGPQPRPGEAVRHVVPLKSTDMSLSKTHAQFHVARDGVLVVMDRGSTNGSVLIRKGMSRDLAAGKPATLVDGDRVKLGDREMLVARES